MYVWCRKKICFQGSLVTAGENVGKIYTDGCLKALGDWINANALVAGGVLLAILVPQVLYGDGDY